MNAGEDRSQGSRAGCVQSLVRAFALLDQLAGHEEGLTLTQAASMAGLPRSTAHRLLTTMESVRYAAFDLTTNRWVIGARALAFAGRRTGRDELARLARPIMQSLLRSVRATVSFSVREGDEVRYVSQLRPTSEDRAIFLPGDHLPLHTTASGKAMIAHWPAARREALLRPQPLVRLTAQSIVDPDRLEGQLEVVRARGYAVDDQESIVGVRCVAAPVFDRHGRVRAALSVSDSITQMTDARLQVLGAAIRSAARRMTEDFGGAVAA